MIHVAIVDDDEWVRRGRVAALGETDDIVPVIGVDHRSAMAMSLDEWAGIDKVLIDAYFDEADFDHFAGVGVAERIRSVELSPQPTLIVVTGHVLNDVLRLRLAQAGADYLFSHYQVRTVEQLAAAVRDPGAFAIDLVPHPDGLGRLGLSADSRPNDALRWVEREGLHQLFRARRNQGRARRPTRSAGVEYQRFVIGWPTWVGSRAPPRVNVREYPSGRRSSIWWRTCVEAGGS